MTEYHEALHELNDAIYRVVKRLRDLGGRSEYMPHIHHIAADRIEELEAKLADAEVIIRIIASDKWDERLGEAVDLACEYLAELKGEKQ